MEYFIGTGRLLTQGAAFQRTAPCFMRGRDCKIDGNCRNLTLPVSRASICVSDGRRTAQHKPLLVRYDGITPLIGGEHHERNAHHHPNRADRGRPHPHTQICHVSGGDAGRPDVYKRQIEYCSFGINAPFSIPFITFHDASIDILSKAQSAISSPSI